VSKFCFICLLLFTSSSLKAEELITFDLNECLKFATHIFKGTVLDEEGRVRIDEVLKGKHRSKELTFREFKDLNQYGDYAPVEKKGWQLYLFLKADSLDANQLNPICYWENSSAAESVFLMTLSILWIKEDYTYCSVQPTNPGPVVFGKRGTEEKARAYIVEYINVGKKIKRIEKIRRCKRKGRKLKRLYNETILKALVFEALAGSNCDKEILAFIRPHLIGQIYSVPQRTMLRKYVEIGREKVQIDLDQIFEEEFAFWKTYIPSGQEKIWWRYDSKYIMKFAYFRALLTAMAENKVGDWKEKCQEAIQFFRAIEYYDQGKNYGKIHEQLERYLKE